MADKALIPAVWQNLIDNPIKFSSNQTNPYTEIGSEERADCIEYYIKDDGVGFDMNHHNKLFGVFQRLQSSKQFEGTGIDLATVSRIIQKHGGTVSARGMLKEGAILYFTLPKPEST